MTKNEQHQEYLTRDEVARLCRVTTQTIGVWTREGKIPRPVRIGQKLLWHRERLLRCLEKHTVPA